MENNWSADFDREFPIGAPQWGNMEHTERLRLVSFIAEKIQEAVTAREEELLKICRQIFIDEVDWSEWARSDEDAGQGFDVAFEAFELLANKPLQERG